VINNKKYTDEIGSTYPYYTKSHNTDFLIKIEEVWDKEVYSGTYTEPMWLQYKIAVIKEGGIIKEIPIGFNLIGYNLYQVLEEVWRWSVHLKS